MSCVVSCEDLDTTSAGETCDPDMTLIVTIVVEIGYSAPLISYITGVVFITECTADAPLLY